MADLVCNSPDDFSDIASKDTNRIQGVIAKALAANSVFMQVIGGGTFPSGVSDTIRGIIQQQAAPGDSLALPVFTCETDLCNTRGHQDLTDTTDFTFRLEGFRGRGPNVCVKTAFSAFKTSYSMAEDSLKKLITQYINADIRAQLYLRSASKFTANANYDFNSLFTGGSECDLGVKFAPLLPTGPMTFKALHYIARYLKEVLLAEWYSSDKGMSHFRFIGGSDQVEYFRSEVGVQNVMIALTTGGYKLGEVSLTAYSFEQSPAYRGIAFGVDQRPLRATGFNPDGTLALVDPVTIVSNPSKGTAYAKANPAWIDAPYEVGFLIAEGSFERWVPERYVGEGSFKFAPQLHMGELTWIYRPDNFCNAYGDFGWHQYQISRAFKPLRPQHVIPLLYRRCNADLGLINCVDTDNSSFSGADSFTTVGTCAPEACWDAADACTTH
jgi:hypothetical protein